jgi:hypothetical protein
MQPEWTPIALGTVAALLVAYVVFAGIAPMLRRRSATADARARMSSAIAQGSDAKRPNVERARAFVAAAKTALEDLRRPRLAARYAEWAHRLAPADEDIVALCVSSLTAARRYHALERLLWASLAEAQDARTSPALLALEALYEKHLARPERARALRALAASAPSTKPTEVKETPRADA